MMSISSSGRDVRRKARPRGFTLLEIMLVVALIAIVFVGAMPLVNASMRERKLRAGAEDISDFVRAERMAAQESGIRREIEIRPDGLVASGPDGDETLFSTPRGTEFSVKYPGGKWAEADGQWWEFSPTGMVTPMSVRFEEGNDWIELDFDVLTGRVAEERYAF